jgi:hypothetical protein
MTISFALAKSRESLPHKVSMVYEAFPFLTLKVFHLSLLLSSSHDSWFFVSYSFRFLFHEMIPLCFAPSLILVPFTIVL